MDVQGLVQGVRQGSRGGQRVTGRSGVHGVGQGPRRRHVSPPATSFTIVKSINKRGFFFPSPSSPAGGGAGRDVTGRR